MRGVVPRSTFATTVSVGGFGASATGAGVGAGVAAGGAAATAGAAVVGAPPVGAGVAVAGAATAPPANAAVTWARLLPSPWKMPCAVAASCGGTCSDTYVVPPIAKNA